MSNWKNWLRGTGKSRETDETRALIANIQTLRYREPFGTEEDVDAFIFDLITDIFERHGLAPTLPLANALYGTIRNLMAYDGLIFDLPDQSSLANFTLEEGVALRARLKHHRVFLLDHERLTTIWRDKLYWVFSGMLEYFPLSAFSDGEDDGILLPEAPLYDLCDNLPEVLDRLLGTFYDEDVKNAGLFQGLRERFDINAFRASGIPEERWNDSSYKIIMPGMNSSPSSEFLVEGYLQGTPFLPFFYHPLPFSIPFPARFEHTHIVAGTGHGKTQLLQFLIHNDLLKAREDGRSVLVLDSQGDMLRTIGHLKLFDPDTPGSLADRFVLIDPTDVEHPVGLNMFDFDRVRLETLAAHDREMIMNATVETYEYFFGALLGAELTARQGTIFRYIARLMMVIPKATIHTLLDLMTNGEKYRLYMEQLPGTARMFFATQFFDRQFAENKKQITARLWAVLSNTTLERMFSHPTNKIDLFHLTQEGKIILINTAKDFLGHEGSSIFGRFMVSLIAQAAIQRAVLPAYRRTPTFAYIDEAEDYFDENIGRLVNQARKYKIGLIFSHQNLDQLDTSLRASILSSTSIKFAGGLSSKDAHTLGSEFRIDPSFLLSQKKHPNHTEFACYVRNYTATAVSVSIPLGVVEEEPTLDEEEYAVLIRRNQEQYTVSPLSSEIETLPFPFIPKKSPRSPVPPTPENPQSSIEFLDSGNATEETRPLPILRTTKSPQSSIKEQGGGGRQHRYLAHLVKQLAEERAFRASIEEPILNGAGKVDVHLARGDRKIAVEISVTTGRDWELQNVEKCLSAGYEEVLIVSTNARHLKSLARFIPANLDETAREKVQFVCPEDFIAYLDQGAVDPQPTTEAMVRGYKVKVTHEALSPEEIAERRTAVARVIVRSLAKTK